MPPKVLAIAIAAAVAAVVVAVWARADPSVTVVQGAPAGDALAARSRLRVAPGLKVELWAGEPLVKDITSFCFDSIGRAYVVETGRRRTSVFDIRGLQPWLDDDLSFRTVADRRDFLTRKLTVGDPDHDRFLAALTKSGIGGFRDFNQDGTLDARDLDVESERIRLVWDSDGDGRADSATTFADGFTNRVGGVAAGILAHGTNVWFTSIPDLWRLDAKAVGPTSGSAGAKADPGSTAGSPARSLLLTGFGVHIAFGGHDLHGLVKGPDGRLYFTIADRGSSVTNWEGRVISLPDCGAVFRCEPDGSGFEVFAKGLRNPQELCFDDFGNLWTCDNNADGGDKARWTLVLEGADYGWTIGWQWLTKLGAWNSERLWHTRESNTAAYIVPPVAHIGHGPAGIAWYPGTGMPARYDRHFFVTDFPGGLRTFAVEPDGAFFKVVPEPGADLAGRWKEDNSATNMVGKVLWDLSPVDVAFPPGGGVTIADWVQGWEKTGKGRLWHVSDPALANDPLIAETKRLLAEGVTKRAEKELLALLGHRDQRVRLEAQWELAGRGLEGRKALQTAAEKGAGLATRLHGIWGLVQAVRQRRGSDLVPELTGLSLLNDREPLVRAAAARLVGAARLIEEEGALVRMFADNDPRVAAAAVDAYRECLMGSDGRSIGRRKIPAHWLQRLAPLMPSFLRQKMHVEVLPDTFDWPLIQLDDLLTGDAGAEPMVLNSAALLIAEFGRSLGTNVLATLRRRYEIAGGLADGPVGPRLALLLAQRRLADPQIASVLGESRLEIALEAARAINDVPIPGAMVALAELVGPASLERLRRQADADPSTLSSPLHPPAGRPGDLTAPSSTTRAAQDSSIASVPLITPERTRPSEAISPGGTGRGEGGYRPRSLNFTRDEWLAWVLRRAVNANFRLGDATNAAALGDFAARTDAPESVRVEALEDLADWAKPPGRDKIVGLWRPLPPRDPAPARSALGSAWNGLAADTSTNVVLAAVRAGAALGIDAFAEKLAALQRHPDPSVRAEVARWAGAGAPADVTDLLARLDRGTVAERQTAFAALGGVKDPAATDALTGRLRQLVAGKVVPELQLDVLDAARRAGLSLAAWTNSLPKEDPLAPYRPALAGGDAARGRKVFTERQDLACLRCHKLRGEGGEVGPELTGIGRAKGREYVLRSILFPNAEIAAGYENVVVTRKDGSDVAGVLKSETATELVVASAEDGLVTVKKADIAKRERGPSSMVEGLGDLMSLRELRDLVEALSE